MDPDVMVYNLQQWEHSGAGSLSTQFNRIMHQELGVVLHTQYVCIKKSTQRLGELCFYIGHKQACPSSLLEKERAGNVRLL